MKVTIFWMGSECEGGGGGAEGEQTNKRATYYRSQMSVDKDFFFSPLHGTLISVCG